MGSATLLQLAFLEEKSDRDFPWEKFPLGKTKRTNTNTQPQASVLASGDYDDGADDDDDAAAAAATAAGDDDDVHFYCHVSMLTERSVRLRRFR